MLAKEFGYVPDGDKRIIAVTKEGGGESTTVKFSTTALNMGARYAFFCTSPGHASMMRGKFPFVGTSKAQAGVGEGGD